MNGAVGDRALPALAAIVWLAVASVGAQSPSPGLRTAILEADDARVTTAVHRSVTDDALASGVPDVQVAALRAIGRTRRAEWMPRAVAALANPSLDVRREAAFAIAHIGSGAPEALATARRALGDALGRETDMLVCAALAEEYGRLPFPTAAEIDEAARALRALLVRLGGPGRAAPIVELGVARGAEALARRAAQMASSPDALVALLGDAYAPERVAADAPRDVLRARMRRLAVSGLLSMDRLTSAQVDRALTDADAQVRRLGVLAQSRRDMTTPSPELARRWLTDDAVIVRHAVAARIGPKVPAIAEAAAGDAHVNVRLAALDALGEAAACRAPCSARLDKPDAFGPNWHEGAHALVAFARTDPDAARDHVVRGAGSGTWQARMYAARAARHTRQADVIERLARDTDVNVRHAALVAWREAGLPGLTAAAVSALASDDGQLVLEAANALGAREPAPTPDVAAGSPTGVAAGSPTGVAAGSPTGVAAGLVPRTIPRDHIVTALRATLARLTAQRRDTSRDPRLALIERIAELDADKVATLRPYLDDFDPLVAERAAASLPPQGRDRSPTGPLPTATPPTSPSSTSPSPTQARSSRPSVHAPTWEEVERLGQTTLTLTLRGGRRLVLRLYAEHAPTAVARLVAQVQAGEWNGRTFHRVEPGFVVQGGSPAANEYAGAAAFTRDEFSALSHVRGTVGISTRGPDTGDGQIFVNLVDNARLDYAYTLIGALTGDPSLLDDIVEGEVIVEASVDGYVAAGLVRPAVDEYVAAGLVRPADRRTSPAATNPVP